MKYLLNKVGIQAETVPCRIWDRSDNRSEFVSKNATNHSIIRFKTDEGWFYSDPTFDACEPDKYKGKYLFKTKKEMSMLHGLDETQINIDSPDVRPEKYSERNIAKMIRNIRNRTKVQQESKTRNTSKYEEHPENKTRLDENPENFKRRMKFEVPQEVQEEIVKKHQQMEQELSQTINENPEHRKIDDVEYGIR